MNKKQLQAFLHSYLSRSPNRRVEIAQAIEERLRRPQGKHRPGNDALDDWIASCLRGDRLPNEASLESRIAEFLEQHHSEETTIAGRTGAAINQMALRVPPSDTPLPFSEPEIREQVKSVLRTLSKPMTTPPSDGKS